jgi:hypothetical protein
MTDISDWSDPCRDDREPDESAYLDAQAAHDYELHCRRLHGGRDCNCPPVGIPTGGGLDSWDW